MIVLPDTVTRKEKEVTPAVVNISTKPHVRMSGAG